MGGYTKLDASIITSTVWAEPGPTKLVWITMLALSDAEGLVDATVPGLAHAAGVTLAECDAAIEKFLSPDIYSRSQEHEGRRIERVGGVFRLLNYAKYRYKNSADWKREQDAEKHRRWRAQQRAKDVTQAGQSGDASPNVTSMSHQAEADAEADAEDHLQQQPAREGIVDAFFRLLGDRLVVTSDSYFRIGKDRRVVPNLAVEIARVGGPSAAVEAVFDPVVRNREKPQMYRWYLTVLRGQPDAGEAFDPGDAAALADIMREIPVNGDRDPYLEHDRREAEARRILAERKGAACRT